MLSTGPITGRRGTNAELERSSGVGDTGPWSIALPRNSTVTGGGSVQPLRTSPILIPLQVIDCSSGHQEAGTASSPEQ